ncbi:MULTISPECIES: NAD(P)H-quinone oxidoreductase subunit 4 [Leptolyngbya]|uniref:NAD(P)H-quinone oxidoreductase subunit 4 n=1 Tax=Leptolyngbya TaxID=47251 RepID=UPI00168566FE|nr:MULTISPECIES: NAD(P)H-quinone oxidoreductase subunit 4 [unclassified Leptolyngbya]MBD1854058.1 NAD(P)H-quinone oxidoreductase subunit 4 [Leptolyngbya sp. FACHB-1624]MBN8560814.1 NAD(P)H-quinone oxidoreductase subunit 4 [Leptolyngbya sp. UWPOB_LEPTO1]MCY6490969.1 NAD(P)H-quinone oxidoreductase subunit 4 [Leptolyngbya sp. GGD]
MVSTSFPWLTAIIALPLVASFMIPLVPDKQGKTVRWYGLGVGLADLVLAIYAFWKHYDFQNPDFQLVENYAWIPQIGVNWTLAVDGISMPLVILAALVTTLSMLAGWKVTNKPRLFYFLLLIMYSAQIGVFCAQDMIQFFLLWEVELVPVYILIAIWGGPKRLYAATKFILYTALASIFILVSALSMAFYGDNFTFNMQELGLKDYSLTFELLAYVGFLIAYGVKLPIFPLHTWLPDAHGEASAPVSMILAGVLLKMGGYALIRMNMEMLPHAHVYFAPILAILGIVNIIYGALASFAQRNLKRRMAYSSISHMGFVLLGIASFTELGMSGAVLQMVSHGLIAAALFFLAGVTYDRTHTLDMDEMGGLAKKMPSTFALFTICSMASLALPGMSGFVGELAIFLGFTSSDAYTSAFKVVVLLLAAVGLILTPIYLLSMLREMFYGKEGKAVKEIFLDANPRELFITASLIVPIIAIGLYPKLITQTYDAKTVQVAQNARNAVPVVAQQMVSLPGLAAPQIPAAQPKLLGMIK